MLIVVVNFLEKGRASWADSGQYIVHVIDDSGKTIRSEIKALYNQKITQGSHSSSIESQLQETNDSTCAVGPFFSVDEIKKLMQEFCIQERISHLRILTMGQYNEILLSSANTEDLGRNLIVTGDLWENTEHSEAGFKKGLLDKIFT